MFCGCGGVGAWGLVVTGGRLAGKYIDWYRPKHHNANTQRTVGPAEDADGEEVGLPGRRVDEGGDVELGGEAAVLCFCGVVCVERVCFVIMDARPSSERCHAMPRACAGGTHQAHPPTYLAVPNLLPGHPHRQRRAVPMEDQVQPAGPRRRCEERGRRGELAEVAPRGVGGRDVRRVEGDGVAEVGVDGHVVLGLALRVELQLPVGGHGDGVPRLGAGGVGAGRGEVGGHGGDGRVAPEAPLPVERDDARAGPGLPWGGAVAAGGGDAAVVREGCVSGAAVAFEDLRVLPVLAGAERLVGVGNEGDCVCVYVCLGG